MATDASQSQQIAIYCRVSTDEQAKEGVSLDEQKARLHAYCRAMGWPANVAEFVDDGYSAKNLDRPALQALLREVENGRISKLLVTKLDRLSRRLLDLLRLIELLQTHEVSFASTSESFDTDTPSGRLTLQVLGAVAEFERERIRERVMDNMLHAARSGKWLTQHPYGYRLHAKELVIFDPEAVIVRRVFQMFVDQGLGYFAIAKRLNAEGIPSRFNKEWSIRAVKLMLSNPVYMGTLVWNRTDSSQDKRKLRDSQEWVTLPGAVPEIVDEETWKLAQDKVQRNDKPAPRVLSSPHLLSGLLRCGTCGAAMSIGWTGYPKRQRIYRCSAYRNKGTCRSKPYHADLVEQWFGEGLRRLLDAVDGWPHEVMIERVQRARPQSYGDQVRVARTRYDRQIEAYTAGLIDLDTLTKEKQALDRLLGDGERAGKRDNGTVDVAQMERDLAQKASTATAALALLTVELAKARIRTLVDKVILHGAEDIEIVLL